MTITALNWTPQDTERLRHAIRQAVENGGSYVNLGPGQVVSLEYARHRLACLDEAHPKEQACSPS